MTPRAALSRTPTPDDDLDRVATRWQTHYALTPAETDVLRGILGGLDRRGLAEARGVALDTVTTQLRKLREKTGDPTLLAMMARALREA